MPAKKARSWSWVQKLLLAAQSIMWYLLVGAQSGRVSWDQAALLHERTIFGTDSSEAKRGRGQ